MLPICRALIADDEPLLRRHLHALLSDLWPELQIVAVASDGEEAWDLAIEHTPDVAFLDIRMPGMDGMELARKFRQLDAPPLVIFTTAFDQHAVEAFENEAIDYLLKPIEESRLEKAIARLQVRLQARQNGQPDTEMQKLQQMLTRLLPGMATGLSATAAANANTEDAVGAGESQRLKWIKASFRDALFMLDVNDVDFFQAEDKYTTVSSKGQEYLIRTSITTLEQQLDPEVFWRIHRGVIVRVAQISKVERDFAGHMSVTLKNNLVLPVSRAFQNLFRQM